MTMPQRKQKAWKRIPAKRKKPRTTKTVIKCRAHCKWVVENFQCLLAGKVNKRTGVMHECVGEIEPHHDPSRGAGGGDNNVVPLCHLAHRLSHDDPRTEEDYGENYRETGDALWQASPARRVYEMKQRGR